MNSKRETVAKTERRVSFPFPFFLRTRRERGALLALSLRRSLRSSSSGMEATRERPREGSLFDDAYTPTAVFDPSAVPRAYAFPATATTQRASWEQFESDDLISLGQEQLFSGSRTNTVPQTQNGVQQQNGQRAELVHQASTPIVSEVRSGSQRSCRRLF